MIIDLCSDSFPNLKYGIYFYALNKYSYLSSHLIPQVLLPSIPKGSLSLSLSLKRDPQFLIKCLGIRLSPQELSKCFHLGPTATWLQYCIPVPPPLLRTHCIALETRVEEIAGVDLRSVLFG